MVFLKEAYGQIRSPMYKIAAIRKFLLILGDTSYSKLHHKFEFLRLVE